jgi:hypothetical protein
MMTILRAVLPTELFGREDYGTILGMIAAPANLTPGLRTVPVRRALGVVGQLRGRDFSLPCHGVSVARRVSGHSAAARGRV